MKNLRSYPSPLGGLTLGFAGAAFFWAGLFSTYSKAILNISFFVVLLLLTPLLLKFLRYPRLLHEELKHPTVGSVLPTFAMTLMILVHTVQQWSDAAAAVLWGAAVLLHLGFFVLFLWHRYHDFSPEKVLPSWFIPPVGLIVACLTVPMPSLHGIAFVLLYFGLFSYFILLPLMLYRLFLHEKLDDARKPSFAVLAAPPNLCLAGYLTLATHPDPLLVLVLASFAMLMTVCVYLLLLHLIRLPFNLANAAFTFPLVIGGRAMLNFSTWLQHQPLYQVYAQTFYVIALVQAVVAILMVLYVGRHYILYLHKHHIL